MPTGSDNQSTPRLSIVVSSLRDALNPTTFGIEDGIVYKVGRAKDAHIRLSSLLVSSHHLDVQTTDGGYLAVRRWGTNSVFMETPEDEEKELQLNEMRVVPPGSVIRLDPFRIDVVAESRTGKKAMEDSDELLSQKWYAFADAMHGELIKNLLEEYESPFASSLDSELMTGKIEKVAEQQVAKLDAPLAQYRIRSTLQMWALRLAHTGKVFVQSTPTDMAGSRDFFSSLKSGTTVQLKQVVAILKSATASITADDEGEGEAVKKAVQSVMFEIEPYRQLILEFDCKKYLWDRVYGYGNLQELVDDPLISEIMVNSPEQIFVERAGKIRPVLAHLGKDEETRRILEKIVAPIGRHIDYSSPLVDARLPDMRVNAVLGNVALGGTSITIRKFKGRPLSVTDLQARGSVSPQVAAFLGACIHSKRNILIYGGTGTGKTTLLNILARYIPPHERVVTIEDSAELQLTQQNLVRLEARPASSEGTGKITIRDLVRNALRMRPDRIIVGECRGAEAFDMLQAMSTGHPGSMGTAHATAPEDLFMRLEAMTLEAYELPVSTIREQIATALDLTVELERQSAGNRVISRVSEIAGVHPTTGKVISQDIYMYSGEGIAPPRWLNTGYVPSFMQELLDRQLLTMEEFTSC